MLLMTFVGVVGARDNVAYRVAAAAAESKSRRETVDQGRGRKWCDAQDACEPERRSALSHCSRLLLAVIFLDELKRFSL
jgi:hypothetical protein